MNYASHAGLLVLLCSTYSVAAYGQSYPVQIPGPAMPTPSPPPPASGYGELEGGEYMIYLPDSGDWSNLNLPNPPYYEEIYDGSTKIGTFNWAASYSLGPVGILTVTAVVTHHTYSLETGTHVLTAYGNASDPPYYSNNPEDPWPGFVFWALIQECRVWRPDWKIKVVVSDPYIGNYVYYLYINDPNAQSIESWGKRQFWHHDLS